MRVSKEYRDPRLFIAIFYVLCLLNVCVAAKCLSHEGPVVEMCTDTVIQAQHAVILDTSLFTTSKGNCVCQFSVTGSYLEIGHLDFPEQCGSKLDFRLGTEGSSSSEVQSIDCFNITAEFNSTEVKDGSVVISHTQPDFANPGFCVSVETDPAETISVHCTAVPEESTVSHKHESSTTTKNEPLPEDSTGSHKSKLLLSTSLNPLPVDSPGGRKLKLWVTTSRNKPLPEESTVSHKHESSATTKNELTPISIKDMFQDQSTGASNAIQELLSKSGISADSIFLEPNLIQTPINSLGLMDKMVTPASFGEDKTEATNVSMNNSSTVTPKTATTSSSPISQKTTTQEKPTSTVAPLVSTETNFNSTHQETTHLETTNTTESSTISESSSTISSTSTTSSSTTSTFPITNNNDTQSLVENSSAVTSSTPETSTATLTTAEHSPSSTKSSTSLPASQSTPSPFPYSTTMATEETTTHLMEETTKSEETSTQGASLSSSTASPELTTTTSTPEDTKSMSPVMNLEITKEVTTSKPAVEFSSTEKRADITTSVLSTTILGMTTSSEGKTESSTPHSDLTTSVLSSTPTSLPETTSHKDSLRLEPSVTKTAVSKESTTADIKPTRTLNDGVTTPSMIKSSIGHEVISSMEISTPMYNTLLPDLYELYSEELLRLASSTVFPYAHSTQGSAESPKSDITSTSSPEVSTEKPTTEQDTTAATQATTTDSPIAIKEETKTTEHVTSTTPKAVTTVQVETTTQTEKPLTEEKSTMSPSTSTARTTSKTTTTQGTPSTTTEKPTTTAAKATPMTFKPTTEGVVSTEARKTTHANDSKEPSSPKPNMVPSVKPRADTDRVHSEHETAKPVLVDKPVMTRLPPIVIPVDSTKQITFKPSFTPGHSHGGDKHGESKPQPPEDLSTVNDSEQLDDDTITVIVVGSVIGILVFIAIIVILATFLKSRRNASKQTEEKDDIEMNGGTKGIDNPLLQLEEEESMANGTAAQSNGKANGVVEGKTEESTTESGQAAAAAPTTATAQDSLADGKTTENNSDDLQ